MCVEYLICLAQHKNHSAIRSASSRSTECVFTAELSLLEQLMHGSVLALSCNPFIPSWSLCTVSVTTTGRDVMVGGVRCFCSSHPSGEQRVSEVCTGERLFLKNQRSNFRLRDRERNKSAYLYFKSGQQLTLTVQTGARVMHWPQ